MTYLVTSVARPYLCHKHNDSGRHPPCSTSLSIDVINIMTLGVIYLYDTGRHLYDSGRHPLNLADLASWVAQRNCLGSSEHVRWIVLRLNVDELCKEATRAKIVSVVWGIVV